MQKNIDINKIVLEAFKSEFPGAPEAEVNELIQEIGETIMIESLAKVLDEIEEKDKTEGKVLYNKVKNILEQENESQDVDKQGQDILAVSDICVELDIDLEKIFQDVATDVIKDVLEK